MTRQELILLVVTEFSTRKNPLDKESRILSELLIRLEDTTGMSIFEFDQLQALVNITSKHAANKAILNIYSF